MSTATYSAAELWARLEAFELDDPASAFPFSARLARENDWSRAYAKRAIVEYKRFLVLLVVAGHPVTPSIAVDQVWHLHMTYTRSYWDDLCGRVLERAVHHNPTAGGPAEDAKFRAWYAQTLESYQQLFGLPPADVWSSVGERFSGDAQIYQVSAKTHWIIRKPTFGSSNKRRGAAASDGGETTYTGADGGKANGDGSDSGGDGDGGGGGDGGCGGGGCGGGCGG